jgi:hypothetical protein
MKLGIYSPGLEAKFSICIVGARRRGRCDVHVLQHSQSQQFAQPHRGGRPASFKIDRRRLSCPIADRHASRADVSLDCESKHRLLIRHNLVLLHGRLDEIDSSLIRGWARAKSVGFRVDGAEAQPLELSGSL